MFNIIETLRNYFIRELLHDNLSSDVALHFNVSYWRPHLVVSCSEEVCRRPVRLLWKIYDIVTRGKSSALSRISPRVKVRVSVSIVYRIATGGYSRIWPSLPNRYNGP